MSAPPKFKVKEVLSHGVSNPIVNRLTLQFFQMLDSQLIDIPSDRIDLIKGLLFELTKELLYIYDVYRAFIALEDKHTKEIKTGSGLQFRPNAFSFIDPTEELRKLFEDSIIHLAIAHRKLARIASLVFGRELKGGKALREYLYSILPQQDLNREWIASDDRWLKELYRLRGLAEHEELKVSAFDVHVIENGEPQINFPALADDNALLHDYIGRSLENMFGHCEDVITLMLGIKADPMVVIVQIPTADMEAYRGFRYVLTLGNSLGTISSDSNT